MAKRVLAVDDTDTVREVIKMHLVAFGCEVFSAVDGGEGFLVAKRERPDLILLDVMMPVMTGPETLAALRQDPETKDIPVIMLTAEATPALVKEVARLGVSGYIVKPFNRATFAKEVDKVLNPTSETRCAPSEAAQATPDQQVDPTVVLVIDDSRRVLDAARATLENTMKVLTATSAKEAIPHYAEKRPGVVVIDLVMPEMDGFDTLDALKRMGGNQTQFIALCLKTDVEARQRARKVGFCAVVDKPIQPEALLEAVSSKLVGESSLEDFFSEESGCPVIMLRTNKSKALIKFMSLARKKVRDLVEDGHDRLIIDLTTVTEVTNVVAKTLSDVLSEARALGLRTAICAPAHLVANLNGISETSGLPYAPDRNAAAQALG